MAIEAETQAGYVELGIVPLLFGVEDVGVGEVKHDIVTLPLIDKSWIVNICKHPVLKKIFFPVK